jgi:hypothetical protein
MQNSWSGTDKQIMEIKTRELRSLVVTKYTRLKDVLTFNTFLQSLPENSVWSGKHASYAFEFESSCHKIYNISYYSAY